MSKSFYTPRDLAQELGQSERTAKRVLRECEPQHVGHWRLSWQELETAAAAVRLSMCRFGSCPQRKRV